MIQSLQFHSLERSAAGTAVCFVGDMVEKMLVGKIAVEVMTPAGKTGLYQKKTDDLYETVTALLVVQRMSAYFAVEIADEQNSGENPMTVENTAENKFDWWFEETEIQQVMTAERMKLAAGYTVETSVNMKFDEKTAETKGRTAGRKNLSKLRLRRRMLERRL